MKSFEERFSDVIDRTNGTVVLTREEYDKIVREAHIEGEGWTLAYQEGYKAGGDCVVKMVQEQAKRITEEIAALTIAEKLK